MSALCLAVVAGAPALVLQLLPRCCFPDLVLVLVAAACPSLQDRRLSYPMQLVPQ